MKKIEIKEIVDEEEKFGIILLADSNIYSEDKLAKLVEDEIIKDCESASKPVYDSNNLGDNKKEFRIRVSTKEDKEKIKENVDLLNQ